MKITLKKINDKLSYNVTSFPFLEGKITLSDLNDIRSLLFDTCYSSQKCAHAFVNMINENEKKINNDKEYFFLDYSDFLNLYLLFENDTKLIHYVQDTCEARGEEIPKTLDECYEFLASENIYCHKIVFHNINSEALNNFFFKS